MVMRCVIFGVLSKHSVLGVLKSQGKSGQHGKSWIFFSNQKKIGKVMKIFQSMEVSVEDSTT